MASWKGHIFSTCGAVLGVLKKSVEDVILAAWDYLSSAKAGMSLDDGPVRAGVSREGNELVLPHVGDQRELWEMLHEVNCMIHGLQLENLRRGGLGRLQALEFQQLLEKRELIRDILAECKRIEGAGGLFAVRADLDKVLIENRSAHIIQYVGFADMLGKMCPRCRRAMKLQWRRDVVQAGVMDFYWGCTGWYERVADKGSACRYTEALRPEDRGLIVNMATPEFDMSADEFVRFASDAAIQRKQWNRLEELRNDRVVRSRGISLATCPVHGEHLVLRKKRSHDGYLLDAFFLGCPCWRPDGHGCSYIEKLKSFSQIAAVLRSETGDGIVDERMFSGVVQRPSSNARADARYMNGTHFFLDA